MAYYTLTIFLSAFLLFALQPLMGKYLLPWFGGGAAVWTVCMLFFQCMLLAGYTYSHLVSRIGSHQRQVLVHGALLLVSDVPVTPDGVKTEESGKKVTANWVDLHLQIGIEAMTELGQKGEEIKHLRY